MTAEEKLKKINAACDLIREAMGKLCEAQALMDQCDIWMATGLHDYRYTLNVAYGESNVMVRSGIKKLEKITGTSGQWLINCMTGRDDESRRMLYYRGIKFEQKGKPNEYKFE